MKIGARTDDGSPIWSRTDITISIESRDKMHFEEVGKDILAFAGTFQTSGFAVTGTEHSMKLLPNGSPSFKHTIILSSK